MNDVIHLLFFETSLLLSSDICAILDTVAGILFSSFSSSPVLPPVDWRNVIKNLWNEN